MARYSRNGEPSSRVSKVTEFAVQYGAGQVDGPEGQHHEQADRTQLIRNACLVWSTSVASKSTNGKVKQRLVQHPEGEQDAADFHQTAVDGQVQHALGVDSAIAWFHPTSSLLGLTGSLRSG